MDGLMGGVIGGVTGRVSPRVFKGLIAAAKPGTQIKSNRIKTISFWLAEQSLNCV